MQDLIEMLRYRRPHGSAGERKFINRFIKPLGARTDEYGNNYLIVGNPTVLFSAHTDSVHMRDGKQKLAWIKSSMTLCLASDEKVSNCLGADNAAGVWILTELIKAQVPGLYVFHREEEIGCKGSKFFASKGKALLDGIQAAVAFDRRNTRSVITHQMMGRCCSDAFGLSLASALGMGHKLDDGGSFTDTASYMDIVPECTNISVGFDREHSSNENLDVDYLLRLRDAVIDMDWSSLEIKRDPTAVDEDLWSKYRSSNVYSYGSGSTANRKGRSVGNVVYRDMIDLVTDHPWAVADFLEHNGVTEQELAAHVAQVEGDWYGKEYDDDFDFKIA